MNDDPSKMSFLITFVLIISFFVQAKNVFAKKKNNNKNPVGLHREHIKNIIKVNRNQIK